MGESAGKKVAGSIVALTTFIPRFHHLYWCTSDHPSLERSRSGALISITGWGRFVYLNDRLRPPGLSAGRFPVLMLLCKKQNIMQKTTDRHYHPDTEAITRSVRKLKDAGYIRRIIDPDDRRAVRLFLTKKGVRAAPLLEAIEGNGRNGSAQVFPRGICRSSGP
jgi:DNA-binding MarR family transcriptional regulator